MELGHYFIENQNSEPFEHRAFISLLDSGIDEESGLRDHSYITQAPVGWDRGRGRKRQFLIIFSTENVQGRGVQKA